jgi:TRAP-type transport system periplasmic protein
MMPMLLAKVFELPLVKLVYRRSRLMALIASSSLSFAAPASAQVAWLLATEYPQSNISGVGLATFAKLVSARTSGFVTIRNAFDNELKIGSGELAQAAQERRVIGGDAFAGPLEVFDPIFGLSSLPFVVQSIDASRAVNVKARPLYERALAAQGLKLLYTTIWPSTGLWSDRSLTSPDDLRAMAVRTYDYNSAEVMRPFSASAQYMPFNDAIARIKDGKLNAVVTSGDGGAGRKLWDYFRYFTPINYAIPISVAFIRADAFESLPKEIQDRVIEAARETEQSQFELLAGRNAENYARMRENGVSIAEPAPAAVIAALKRGATAPISAWKAKVSAEAATIVDWAASQQ